MAHDIVLALSECAYRLLLLYWCCINTTTVCGLYVRRKQDTTQKSETGEDHTHDTVHEWRAQPTEIKDCMLRARFTNVTWSYERNV